MEEADKRALCGTGGDSLVDQCAPCRAKMTEREAGAEGSGFPCVFYLVTPGVRHQWAGDRRAISVTSPVFSRRADCALSFSARDFKTSLPRLDPADHTCERK
jgi:hypothetical protein